MNLIITCQRNLEDPTILEAQNMLERFGDVDAIIEKTVFSGIIQAQTSLDNIKVLDDFRELIDDEPWLIKYCSRIIPIQAECESKLDEITNKAIEYTKKRLELFNLQGELSIADAEKLPFKENQFNFIWSWGVIHHSKSTENILREIHRVLSKGGVCKVMVYNKNSLRYYLFGF